MAAAGFEARHHDDGMTALFTIQMLAPNGYSGVDLDAAQASLTAAYASAFAELSRRVEEAQRGR